MALTVVSCVEPLAPQPGLRDGAFGINLSVVCKAPDTKATKPGEDQYNENALNRIDWFVFKDGTEAAIAHGRIIGSNGVVASTTVSLDEFADPASGISGKVYVIANLPATRFKHDDAKGILQSTDGGTTWGTAGALTRTALEALAVVASFDALDAGKFKKQDEFVMRGETPFALTPAATTQTVTAPLDRLAAKVTMQLSVVPAIDEIITMPNGDYLYTKTWYPELDKINVYLSYADNHATIAADPEDSEDSQAQSSGFFTYNRYAYKTLYSYTGAASSPSATFPSTVTPHWDEDWFWQVTGSPFYTYPIEWKTSSSTAPFIKVILPWTSYDESAGIVAPDGHFVRAGRAKDSSKKGKTQEFYYKIALPSENTTDDKKLQLLCNEWYDLILDVSILGGPSDDLPLELAGQYYVVDWSNPDFTAGGALKQGRYLSVARDTFYIYGGNSIEIPVQSSHDVSATFKSVKFKDFSTTNPGDVTYTYNANTGRWRSGNTNVSFTASATGVGRTAINFTHVLKALDENSSSSNKPDVTEYTFDLTIQNSAGLSKEIVIVQQPTLMIQNDRNSRLNSDGAVYVNWYTVNWYTNRNGYTFSNYYYDQHWIGGVNGINNSSESNSNPNMYVISTSVAPSGMVIADPRQSNISYCGESNYNWSSPQGASLGTTGQRRLQHYYPADETESGVNKIAPKFRIASSYGYIKANDGNFLTYREAQKRCASYQEDGLPAGRWRIPTKAEMEFMITLSNIEVIPSLFTPTNYSQSYQIGGGWNSSYITYEPNYGDGGYWTADGGVIYPWTNEEVGYLNAADFATHSSLSSLDSGYAMKTNGVRCVYDEWFWGLDDRLANANRTTFTWGDRQIQ